MQKKNIDPEIDLKDEDEEPALPELGDDTDVPGAAAVAEAGHSVIIERSQADTSGTILRQDAEQVFRIVLRGTAPGQEPRDRVSFQFA